MYSHVSTMLSFVTFYKFAAHCLSAPDSMSSSSLNTTHTTRQRVKNVLYSNNRTLETALVYKKGCITRKG